MAAALCWYALQTRPQNESITAERLDRLGFVESYSPQAHVETVRKGRVVEIEMPAFPTYLLCRMPATAEAWRAASDTEGVSRMLGKDAEGTPMPLRQGEVDEIKRREDRHELEPPTEKKLRRNHPVRIRFGYFVNQVGMLIRRKRERARIRLSLLGSEIEIDIPVQAIEPA
jgi:transcriptional antiterminator NusG